jgi:hypothetical protein
VNWRLVWTGIEEAKGDRVIEVKLAAAVVTWRVAVPFTLPVCAVIVTEPAAFPVARPVLEMEVTFGSEEVHWTELVMSFVVPSERCAVAVNGCVAAIAIDIEVGET